MNLPSYCTNKLKITVMYKLSILVFPSPRLIDMGKVYQQSNLENLEQAFGVAERDLGVTRLLDPEGTTRPIH